MEEKNAILTFLFKWWAYLCYIMIGILAKFSYDIIKGRKITFWQAIGTIGLSAFVGYLATIWCIAHTPENAPFIVPLVTLSAREIVSAFMTLNYKAIIAEWLEYWQSKFDGNK